MFLRCGSSKITSNSVMICVLISFQKFHIVIPEHLPDGVLQCMPDGNRELQKHHYYLVLNATTIHIVSSFSNVKSLKATNHIMSRTNKAGSPSWPLSLFLEHRSALCSAERRRLCCANYLNLHIKVEPEGIRKKFLPTGQEKYINIMHIILS
jgi:hypothetical protein